MHGNVGLQIERVDQSCELEAAITIASHIEMNRRKFGAQLLDTAHEQVEPLVALESTDIDDAIRVARLRLWNW